MISNWKWSQNPAASAGQVYMISNWKWSQNIYIMCKMTTNDILSKSYEHIAEDTKFIRLVTITNFVHSLVFVFVVLYNIYMVMWHLTSKISIDINKYITQILVTPNITTIFAILGLVLVIWQFLLPPIWEAAAIYYINDPEHKGKNSIKKWLPKFFQLFEYDGMFYFFTYFTFIVFVSRLWILDIIWQPIVMTLVIIWWIIVIGVNICIPYARYILVLEDKSIADSVSWAVDMALWNLTISIKLAFITMIMNLRFIINIMILVGIPLLIIYIIVRLGWTNNEFIKYGIYTTVLWLTLLLAYINGIIESFFVCMWYEAYRYIRNGDVSTPREKTLFDLE